MSRIIASGRKGISASDLLGTSSPAPTATSIEASNDFFATTPSDWDGATPQEMQDSIDRLAALLEDWRGKFEGIDSGNLAGDYSTKP